MEKTDKKQEQPAVARRAPGKRLFTPPEPRPIPQDHPARALFSSLTHADSTELDTPEVSTPVITPTVTPTETATITPTATTTVTPTATPTISPQTEVPSSSRRASQSAVHAATAAEDGPRPMQTLDATHTASEQLVYNYMYRETISKGIRERHFGPAELLKATPIRSHVTVRKAIDGLIEKHSIEIISFDYGSRFGPRYRVYEPREINRRRAAAGILIDPGSKRIVPTAHTPTVTPTTTTTTTPTGTATATPTTPTATATESVAVTPTESVAVTPTDSVGVLLNKKIDGEGCEPASAASSSKSGGAARDDDEAFAGLVERLRQTVREVTGREPTAADAARWAELGDLLAEELRSSSSRTAISSAPAFLAEHLRRRLSRPAAAPPPARQADPPRPAEPPAPPTDDELVEMFTGFLHQGMTIEEVEGQFSASIDAERWPSIRTAALERYGRERGQMRPPGQT